MSTIEHVIHQCRQQVPPCHVAKIIAIDKALRNGTPYPKLGGKRIRCRNDLVRFKIGRSWRLTYRETRQKTLIPDCLMSRQQLETSLKRR